MTLIFCTRMRIFGPVYYTQKCIKLKTCSRLLKEIEMYNCIDFHVNVRVCKKMAKKAVILSFLFQLHSSSARLTYECWPNEKQSDQRPTTQACEQTCSTYFFSTPLPHWGALVVHWFHQKASSTRNL